MIPSTTERHYLIAMRGWAPIEARLKELAAPLSRDNSPAPTTHELLSRLALPRNVANDAHWLRVERNRVVHEPNALLSDPARFEQTATRVLAHLDTLQAVPVARSQDASTARANPDASVPGASHGSSDMESMLIAILATPIGWIYMLYAVGYAAYAKTLFAMVNTYSAAWWGLVVLGLAALPAAFAIAAVAAVAYGIYWLIRYFVAHPW